MEEESWREPGTTRGVNAVATTGARDELHRHHHRVVRLLPVRVSAAALVFRQLFFPYSGHLIGVPASLGIYGVGFVARSVGGITFGHYGDKIGVRRCSSSRS